jgi:hypothetical protein
VVGNKEIVGISGKMREVGSLFLHEDLQSRKMNQPKHALGVFRPRKLNLAQTGKIPSV